MLVGNDFSNFQGQIDWQTYIKNSNFALCKASEGTNYIDTWFGFNRQQARQYNFPRGWYHFARPDIGNSPQDEANFFCKLMDGDSLQEGELLILDFEVAYSDPPGWCKAWLDTVSSHFGFCIKPLLYLNQSLATSYDWQPLVDTGYGLWIAAYTGDPNKNDFKTGSWPFAAMQQWTDQQQVPGINGTIDGDVFFGDETAFKAYGLQPATSVQTAPPSTINIITSTTAGTITIPIPVTSTNPQEVPNGQLVPPILPEMAKSTPLTMPQKPPLPIGQLIAFIWLRIKSILKQYIV